MQLYKNTVKTENFDIDTKVDKQTMVQKNS